MKKTLYTILLLSLFLGIFSKTELALDDVTVGHTDCGEPHQVSLETTSCLCLKTLYEGNKCTYSDALKKPFGKECRVGKLEYCCNYIYRLAEWKDCTSFPY
ncbi:hypothetical protein ACHWQZ_G002629 [Mnemiopsis leidyi]